MKNSSIVGAHLAVAVLAVAAALPAAASTCEFRPNAPDQHTVVRGDTLWDISGKFLANPWCWPTVWGMNKDDIKNPHWIYPGQIIYFDRANKRLSLNKPGGDEGGAGQPPTTRLSPQLRTEGLGRDAIASIPAGQIEPFLSQPLIVTEEDLGGAPRIAATRESRVILGTGDTAYVRGDIKGGTSFQVFRPGKPLTDPDTGKLLAYEAHYVGTMKLVQAGRTPEEAHVFTVTNAVEEMSVGDRLMPAPPTPLMNYVPHQPERQVSSRVVSIYRGVTFAGQNEIVAINRGSVDGLDIGATLQVYHFGSTVKDPTAKRSWFGGSGTMKLPEQLYGSLFIFRVFKNVSYGLVMQATDPVQMGDVAKSPE